MGIANTEALLIAKIQGSFAAKKLKTVESLPGNWDDDTMRRLLRQVPGVFVVWAGAQPASARDGGTAGLATGLWLVYCATAHANGEAARRLGDSKQIGAYELVETLIPQLNGLTIPGEGTLALAKVENLYSGTIDKQGLALYVLHFNMPQAWPTEVDESTLGNFEELHGLYDIPPHLDNVAHRKWLNGDFATSKPDAQDTNLVPQ